jgi:tetratricopeptide (TPR) repeat protein
MGWIYTRNREFEKAKEILDQALQIDPENYHANFNLMTLYSRTRDERFEQQKAKFEEIKEKRWQYLTNSLRSIEVVPHYVFPGRSGKDIFTDVQ